MPSTVLSHSSEHEPSPLDLERIDKLERRLRTAIGEGNEYVDLSSSDLIDDDVKLLVRMLEDAEAASKERLRLAQVAYKLSEKKKAEANAAAFEAFEPDAEDDLEKLKYEEACRVQWPDDPIWAVATTVTGEEEDSHLPPPSYRFTPRDERPEGWEGMRARGTRLASSNGRAKLLFRHAIKRYHMRQKALQAEKGATLLEMMADAASLQVDYDERGSGCHHLSLQTNALGSRSAAHLGVLMRGSESLETLALGGNNIGDTGAALLGRALQHTRSLRTLALQDCRIGPKGIRHLSAGLSHNRTVQSLWLFNNDARDEGAAHLAGALRTAKLEALGLEQNNVCLAGCEALAFALSLQGCLLSHLRLQHNRLGDDGVHALTRALLVNRSVTKLQLRDVGVGERGCEALSDALRRNTALRSLSLEDNNLSPSSTEPLLRAMQASSSLTELQLDMGHGGSYGKVHTRDELRKTLTLAFLSKKHGKKGLFEG